jgi:hypothetical protein
MNYNSKIEVQPFKHIKVVCEVDWDIDKDDKPLENHITKQLFWNDLIDIKCLQKENGKWILDGDCLTEWLSDWLSNTYSYCHNGFEYDVIFQK